MKYKIGDKVRVYNGGILKGRISYIASDNEWIDIICDEDMQLHGPYHIKQCRKLKKKPSKIRKFLEEIVAWNEEYNKVEKESQYPTDILSVSCNLRSAIENAEKYLKSLKK